MVSLRRKINPAPGEGHPPPAPHPFFEVWRERQGGLGAAHGFAWDGEESITARAGVESHLIPAFFQSWQNASRFLPGKSRRGTPGARNPAFPQFRGVGIRGGVAPPPEKDHCAHGVRDNFPNGRISTRIVCLRVLPAGGKQFPDALGMPATWSTMAIMCPMHTTKG